MACLFKNLNRLNGKRFAANTDLNPQDADLKLESAVKFRVTFRVTCLAGFYKDPIKNLSDRGSVIRIYSIDKIFIWGYLPAACVFGHIYRRNP